MKLEVLLSVMNLDIKQLDKMNITSKCTVINQCGKNEFKNNKKADVIFLNFNSPNRNKRLIKKKKVARI